MLALAAAAGMVGYAQTLYGGSAKQEGVTFRGWGSGLVRETDELAPDVAHAIRISSRNFYQGGLVRFSKPVSLATALQDKANLLRLTLKFPTAQAAAPVAPIGVTGGGGRDGDRDGDEGEKGARGGGGGGGVLGASGRGGPGFDPSGRGGGPGVTIPSIQRPAAAPAAVPSILRLVITTTDGKKSEAYVDVPAARARSGNWVPVAVPLAAIPGFGETNMEILSMMVASDAPTTLYVREIGVTKDETPIYADMTPSTDLNLAFGDEYTFTASAYGGATQLTYSWNFDAAHTEGTDAQGITVKRRFRKPGQYVVKLTVVDVYGFKKPFTRSIKVTVNP